MNNKDPQSRPSESKVGPQRELPHEALPQRTASEWYDANVDSMVETYERFTFEEVHGWLLNHLPEKPCPVLDVGAGTGRDAAALAERGHTVTAVEPSDAVRRRAAQLHTNEGIHWVRDSLPELRKILEIGLRYDVILLSAVWMHVAPSQRQRAFRRLASLLNPGGMTFITLRHGPHENLSGFWDIPADEVRTLARENGLFEVDSRVGDDLQKRDGVSWTRIVLQSPGDGTGALPLLRSVILNDKKSSTYKLALLRVLLRISQTAGGLARFNADETVDLPLGLFALYWIRLYRPLLDRNLPQNPNNTSGTVRIGFANKQYEMLENISPLDLRVGTQFGFEQSKAVHSAILEVRSTIVKMPMHYMTYPGSNDPIFVPNSRSSRRPASVTLNAEYLFSFGTVRLPLNIWQTVQRYGSWIEPAIVAEWKNLMKRYSETQGREAIDYAQMEQALEWSNPIRNTQIPRNRAKHLIESGNFRHCVWSGRNLTADHMDIDHCFPFSVWPCDDLWNLIPSSRTVNQNQKRDKLPSESRLRAARERLLDWWNWAYIHEENKTYEKRFFQEAAASLPIGTSWIGDLDEVFLSVVLQQLNLKYNQQIPEWV